jgi:hypothetical protein
MEDLWNEAETLESAFYLCCLYFVEGLESGNAAEFVRAEGYRLKSTKLAAGGLVARSIREWVGEHYVLVPREMLPPPELDRLPRSKRLEFSGRIARVHSENEGTLVIDKTGGAEIWFPPHRPGRYLFTQGDVGRIVRFFIGFSFDRPRAWLNSWQ